MTAKCHIMASDDNDQLGRSMEIRGEQKMGSVRGGEGEDDVWQLISSVKII